MANEPPKTTSNNIDWNKVGTVLIAVATFFTIIFYIVDMKVDIAKLQVKVEQLQEEKR